MRLSDFKNLLTGSNEIHFRLPDGNLVPRHFHITEAGLVTRHFIDCGGTIRNEKYINLQVWVAQDVEHRLQPEKLLGILDKAAPLFQDENPEVEIEYQMETIGRFQLGHDGLVFRLEPTFTDCLAKDHCGIPPELMPSQKDEIVLNAGNACCSPGKSACC
jgi:hypothetical protein